MPNIALNVSIKLPVPAEHFTFIALSKSSSFSREITDTFVSSPPISMSRQTAESTLANSNPPVLDDAQRWQYKAPMTEARKDLALISYGGFIFAIGGETEQNVSGLVERYNPNQDQWTSMKSKLLDTIFLIVLKIPPEAPPKTKGSILQIVSKI